VAPKTPSDAVKKPDASGQSVNALEVRVGAEKVDFVVNGVVVHSEPKTGALAKTDGIYGIRVNHLLEVQVDGFGSRSSSSLSAALGARVPGPQPLLGEPAPFPPECARPCAARWRW